MKHLLAVAIILFAFAGLWVIGRVGLSPRLSVSLHAAKTKANQLVFGVLTLVATILMNLTIFGWLLSHYAANGISYILFGLVAACLTITALIPHIEGTWRDSVHNVAAWGIVYILPLIMAFMLLWPLSPFAWYAVAVLVGINSLLLLTALQFYKQCSPWFLYFQTAYLTFFFASLLVVTYC